MFTVRYQLWRNKGRTLLLACAAALMAAALALYLGSIRQSEKALESLGENVPVNVRITTRDGTRSEGLAIVSKYYDVLQDAGVRDVLATCSLAGAYGKEAREQNPFVGGDTIIVGANCMAARPMKGVEFAYLPGEDESFLEGMEPKCLLDAVYAERNAIKAGDDISMPMYLSTQTMGYIDLGEMKAKVIGTYETEDKTEHPISMLVPAGWLRSEADKAGKKIFLYDSLSAVVSDPLRLNEFKAALTEGGFAEPVKVDEEVGDTTGDSASVEDKLFIKAAMKIEENTKAYKAFLAPFFALMIGLITLVIFLTLRNARKDMAVAISLGQGRGIVAFSHLAAVMAADLLGCAVALPVMTFAAGLPVVTALSICGIFLLCALLGTALALVFLLRFDALSLLVKVD